jgi:hypothetical protein
MHHIFVITVASQIFYYLIRQCNRSESDIECSSLSLLITVLETIWSDDRNILPTKLSNCLKLNLLFARTLIFAQPRLDSLKTLCLQIRYTFCSHVSKIMNTFDLIEDYQHLRRDQRRFEGLLLWKQRRPRPSERGIQY